MTAKRRLLRFFRSAIDSVGAEWRSLWYLEIGPQASLDGNWLRRCSAELQAFDHDQFANFS